MTGFRVGDEGQRYEVRYTEDFSGKECVLGWSETYTGALSYCRSVKLHPAMSKPKIIDRQADKE